MRLPLLLYVLRKAPRVFKGVYIPAEFNKTYDFENLLDFNDFEKCNLNVVFEQDCTFAYSGNCSAKIDDLIYHKKSAIDKPRYAEIEVYIASRSPSGGIGSSYGIYFNFEYNQYFYDVLVACYYGWQIELNILKNVDTTLTSLFHDYSSQEVYTDWCLVKTIFSKTDEQVYIKAEVYDQNGNLLISGVGIDNDPIPNDGSIGIAGDDWMVGDVGWIDLLRIYYKY